MNIMGYSIQEILKKINSSLSVYTCLSLLVTTVFLMVFTFYIFRSSIKNTQEITYIATKEAPSSENVSLETLPFGSISGTTYTYTWCKNSGAISSNNKIYFKDSQSAEQSGRTLSKHCNK